MLKLMSSIIFTPTAWAFAIGMIAAGLMGLWYALKVVAGIFICATNSRREEKADVTVGDVVEDAVNTVLFGSFGWLCWTSVRRLAAGRSLFAPTIVALGIVALLIFTFYALLVAQVRREERQDIPDDEQIEMTEVGRRKRGLALSVVLLLVAAIAIPVSVLAVGKAPVAKPKQETAKSAVNKPEDVATTGEDDAFLPSDLDADALVEKWYGKYSSGKIILEPYKEYDDERDRRSEYKRPVLFPYTDPNNKDLTYEETIRAILDAPTYGGGMAEFLTEFSQIKAQNPTLVKFAEEHRKAYNDASGNYFDGLQHWIRHDPNTDQDVLSDDYKYYAAELCEVFTKFTYGGVEARQTREQWGLPITFEKQEDIPSGLTWKYQVGDTVPNSLRYAKKYTEPEEQDSLPAVIWTYKNPDGSVIEFGTGADNKNFRLFDKSGKRTVTNTVTTTPGNPGNPGTPNTPPSTPPNTPNEPAKDKSKSTANNPNTPTWQLGNNDDPSGTNDQGHNDRQPQNGNGEGTTNRDTTPSGGAGSGGDNNKTSGSSTGTGGSTNATQSNPSGGAVDNGAASTAGPTPTHNDTTATSTSTTSSGSGDSTTQSTTTNTSDGKWTESVEIPD